MKKPVLVVMAAGMGSRYGGLKQIDPIDKDGDIIIDFSIYDAIQAGFEKIVFIIKKENEADFRAAIGDRMSKHIQVEFVFQDLHNLPEGFTVPEGRVKPWGTGHAVLAAKKVLSEPFAVINADDYYGKEAYVKVHDYLVQDHPQDGPMHICMAGFRLGNTLSDNGSVTRGVCHIEDGKLVGVTETHNIFKTADGAETRNIKKEYLLPELIDQLIHSGKAAVDVLETKDEWFGVTYQEDKASVQAAFKKLTDDGVYPEGLYQ